MNKECFSIEPKCGIFRIKVNSPEDYPNDRLRSVRIYNPDSRSEIVVLEKGKEYFAKKREINGTEWFVIPSLGNKGLNIPEWKKLWDNLAIEILDKDGGNFFES